jgi:3-oxoacyl-[acyl-carrier protein] reductase
MELGLAGRVVLVGGGSRGIAYAAAEEFARNGATLVLVSRDGASLHAAQQRLQGLGATAHTVVADLATAEGLDSAIAATQALVPQVDVLVTNTGGPPTGSAMGHAWPAWEQATHLLLRSAVELTRAFVPGMRDRRWGRVVGITSFAVRKPVPSLVLSNSLRAAVTGYFRTLADEVAPDGVTVNTVLPGYTATERLAALAEATMQRTGATREAVEAAWLAETPVGRLGRPDEVGAMIAFLGSDRAGFITGQAICVDGGAVRALY